MTENKTLQSPLYLQDGFSNGQAIKSRLNLQRTSWFEGAILHFDLIHYVADAKDPFSQWILKDFPNIFSRCQKIVVSMSHHNRVNRASRAVAQSVFNNSGSSELILPEFSYQWKTHPDTRRWAIEKYRVMGHCYENSAPDSIDIALPGFASRQITL